MKSFERVAVILIVFLLGPSDIAALRSRRHYNQRQGPNPQNPQNPNQYDAHVEDPPIVLESKYFDITNSVNFQKAVDQLNTPEKVVSSMEEIVKNLEIEKNANARRIEEAKNAAMASRSLKRDKAMQNKASPEYVTFLGKEIRNCEADYVERIKNSKKAYEKKIKDVYGIYNARMGALQAQNHGSDPSMYILPEVPEVNEEDHQTESTDDAASYIGSLVIGAVVEKLEADSALAEALEKEGYNTDISDKTSSQRSVKPELAASTILIVACIFNWG